MGTLVVILILKSSTFYYKVNVNPEIMFNKIDKIKFALTIIMIINEKITQFSYGF